MVLFTDEDLKVEEDINNNTTKAIKVEVTDIKMEFQSMIEFMVKLAFASIPAILIITIVIYMLIGVLGVALL